MDAECVEDTCVKAILCVLCALCGEKQYSVNQCLITICENLWLNFILYLKKQTQFFPFSSPKTTIPPNPNPIQSQFKPNQTQSCQNSATTAFSAVKIIPFYAKRTQTSSFLPQKPRFRQKTNPKQTQTKPNRKTAKMNLSYVLTKRYEKKRLFERNENKPKTNPIFWLS